MEVGAPISLDGVASSRIVGVSAFVVCSLHQKTQKMVCRNKDRCEWVNVSSGTAHPGSPGQRAVKWL